MPKWSMAGRCPRLLELERSLPVDKERQMVRAGREKQQEKRQTLEFRVKFGVWQKPAETNDPYTGDSTTWLREVSSLGGARVCYSWVSAPDERKT